MSFQLLRQMLSSSKPAPLEAPVFSVPEGVRVYAVGDIHGRSGLLKKMLGAIAADAADLLPAKVIEVFLGDYVDRGLQSREVIDLLLAQPEQGHERVCLLGNHEETLLRFLKDPKVLRDWGNFGGFATMASYGVGIPTSMTPEKLTIVRDVFQKSLPEAHQEFLRNLKLSHVVGDYLFVHAGIMPGAALDAQKPEHLLWIRDIFLRHEGFFDHYVVHGHSPVTVAEVHMNRANVDVSAAPIDSLACLVIEGSERRIIMVTN